MTISVSLFLSRVLLNLILVNSYRQAAPLVLKAWITTVRYPVRYIVWNLSSDINNEIISWLLSSDIRYPKTGTEQAYLSRQPPLQRTSLHGEATQPVFRDDIFYTGAIQNVPEYKNPVRV